MARQRRLDIPGMLYHVIARGIERRAIFLEPADYSDFLARLEAALQKTPSQLLAWSLMPNHFHFLVRAGEHGIARLMRRLMSGYALSFNIRHQRRGYLFQNRYKSFLCEEEAYLLELVRYIHLNPLRAGLIRSMEQLARFPYTGHAVLLGNRAALWQDTAEVLRRFGDATVGARRRYEEFVKDGWRPSDGGTVSDLGMPGDERRSRKDSRIVGSVEFVHQVWETLNRKDHAKRALRGGDVRAVAPGVAAHFGIPVSALFLRGRRADVSKAKAAFIHIAVDYMGKTVAEMARLTRMSTPAASKAAYRGRGLAGELATALKVN